MGTLEILATTVLPGLMSPAADMLKMGAKKFFGGGGEPQTVDDVIKLLEAKTSHMRALAEIDKPSGAASQWVVNLRESSRYIAVGIILLTFLAISILQFWITVPQNLLDNVQLMAQSAFFFLFGDRVYLHLRKG